MALITVKDLTLGYDGRPIVEHLDFTVEEGDYLCIVGENGSGKSTLMRTLLGLREPLSGTIEFGSGLKQNEIGYLPQQTQVQRDFPASVWEVVLSGCQGREGFMPFYRKEEKKAAERLLSKLGIENLKNKCYRDLSGGQQQRVLLSRALLAAEKVLLLDEPVSSLDPKAAKEMYQLIEELHKEGITILMISHDVQEAIPYATKVLHIGDGIFFGTREEYLTSRLGQLYTRFGKEGTR